MKIRIKNNPKLGDFIELRLRDESADFWITRRASEETLGKPTKEYNPESFGVRVKEDAKSILDSRYLYYLMEHLWTQGVWKAMRVGPVVPSIRKEDIMNIPIGVG